MKKELKEWYEEINESDILPNGVIKLRVPVLDDEGSGVQLDPNHIADGGTEAPPNNDCMGSSKPEDPVVEKDKGNSLKAFVCAKRIQDLLIQAASLAGPYEEDSETRQAIVDKIKSLHRELGEVLSQL